MPHYDLTEEAEQDIREIVRYTFRQWGETQVRRYQQSLTEKFDAIADGTAIAQTFSENLPDVLVCCCEHHYIFYTSRNRPRPLIIAILHKRRDLVAHLAARLK